MHTYIQTYIVVDMHTCIPTYVHACLCTYIHADIHTQKRVTFYLRTSVPAVLGSLCWHAGGGWLMGLVFVSVCFADETFLKVSLEQVFSDLALEEFGLLLL